MNDSPVNPAGDPAPAPAEPSAPAQPQPPMTPRKALRDIWRIFLFTVALAVLGFLMTSEGQPVPVNLTELDDTAAYGTRFDAFTKFPALLLLLFLGIFFSCRKEPIRSTLGETNMPFYAAVVGFAALLAAGHVVLVLAAI